MVNEMNRLKVVSLYNHFQESRQTLQFNNQKQGLNRPMILLSFFIFLLAEIIIWSTNELLRRFTKLNDRDWAAHLL